MATTGDPQYRAYRAQRGRPLLRTSRSAGDGALVRYEHASNHSFSPAVDSSTQRCMSESRASPSRLTRINESEDCATYFQDLRRLICDEQLANQENWTRYWAQAEQQTPGSRNALETELANCRAALQSWELYHPRVLQKHEAEKRQLEEELSGSRRMNQKSVQKVTYLEGVLETLMGIKIRGNTQMISQD